VPAGGDPVVSLYLPRPTPVMTVHGFAFQDNVVAAGNVTGARTVDAISTATEWFFLSGLSVRTSDPAAASVVAFGDSITDGAQTQTNADHRWPDLLAQRLRRARGLPPRGSATHESDSGDQVGELACQCIDCPGLPLGGSPPAGIYQQVVRFWAQHGQGDVGRLVNGVTA
jgi:GDSL-like Lipase/Acylhydrolase